MKPRLTIGLITARHEPRFDWFFQSLRRQMAPDDDAQIIIVDMFAQPFDDWTQADVSRRMRSVHEESWASTFEDRTLHVPPKPTVWQGPGRLPKENWWGIANARNTIVCLAKSKWVSYSDDRCILSPQWLTAVNDAMRHGYAVCGAYEKRSGMEVKDGLVSAPGELIGKDTRTSRGMFPQSAPGEWFYGCTSALPLEWMLDVNGADETCDGLGLEDSILGRMLVENGHPIKYDPRMRLIEDRTPSACIPVIKRTDKGVSPNDKSHALLERTKGKKRATHHWDIRAIREAVQRGEPFPAATEPKTDWYDGELLSEIYVR